MSTLRTPGLSQRHWDELSALAGKDITPDVSTTMRKMLRHDLMPLLEPIEGVSAGAAKEHSLEKSLARYDQQVFLYIVQNKLSYFYVYLIIYFFIYLYIYYLIYTYLFFIFYLLLFLLFVQLLYLYVI